VAEIYFDEYSLEVDQFGLVQPQDLHVGQVQLEVGSVFQLDEGELQGGQRYESEGFVAWKRRRRSFRHFYHNGLELTCH
jgi:hypothetical protein